MKKNNILTNVEIKEIYKKNEKNLSKQWKLDLFDRLKGYPVSKINKNFKKKYFYEDIKQELLISLWSAIISYDYHKNFDFYRWAKWHLSKANRDFFNKEFRTSSINLKDNYEQYSSPNQESKYLLYELFYKDSLLKKREVLILENNFLYGKTLSEISNELGISTERVRQVRNKAIIKLNKYISADAGEK
jgi:RNA polymerase sigma factor (sigma-70 family)